jgi:RNA polymerase sigma-70 factor (sigma-E family)
MIRVLEPVVGAEVPVTYEEFADSRLGALLRYAVMLTGDLHTAQDLVQDTMVRVQLNWRRVADSDSPDGYVRKMLTNQFIDLRRGSWLRRVLLRAEPDPVRAVPFDHADETAERDRVWGMLAKLPRQQRAALVLRYYEDLPDADIAEVLGCAVGTVRSSISRALATLRADLVEAR